jgi:signal transduction histidine kinase
VHADRLTILAIDDTPDNLTVLGAVLSDVLPGCVLVTAHDGIKGIELALAEDPDVILLDIVMPGMDGFETCARIKSDDRLRDIPVVFLTSLRTDRFSRIKAVDVGAESFLGKPLDEVELVAQIRVMAKLKSASRARRLERDELARLVADRTRALEQELEGRKRVEAELRERTKEVLEQNAELERFTYTVSHDLKSPLVTVRTFLGYLEQDLESQNSDRVAADIKFVLAATKKMNCLLDDLLRLSRIGAMVVSPEHVPLKVVVAEVLELLAGPIARRGVSIEVTDEPLILSGDRPRLVQLFQNLLENAVKYMGTQPMPCVHVGVKKIWGQDAFFVRDNGIGIDSRHAGRIFVLFEKLDPDSAGTGVGLALVRRIVEVHGGSIWMESAGVGLGTTFLFTLAGTCTAEAHLGDNCS